jgi:hypothetical protein
MVILTYARVAASSSPKSALAASQQFEPLTKDDLPSLLLAPRAAGVCHPNLCPVISAKAFKSIFLSITVVPTFLFSLV